ncbi:MAG: hypothetical protein V4556_09620 [Bacteroidota bacterium]
MKKLIILLISFLAFSISYGQTSADRSLKVSVTTNQSPLSFTLRWQKGLNAKSYAVLKKARQDTSWTLLTNTLGVNDTFYVDNNVAEGIAYEYNINATSNMVPFTEYTYVYCAKNFPVKHQQGKIILLVDSNYIIPVATEIKRLEMDLISEGWNIIRKNIGRKQTVRSVKQFIVSIYMSDTANVKGIFILGHIPVPYSGLIFPDGHDEHLGAWPTDAYYCDTSFTYWTDNKINNSSASRAANKNIPGDGKFDSSFIKRDFVKLFSGRVDMFDMPAINSSDTFLMKQYLNKDHLYRTAGKHYRYRGLIEDNFGYSAGEAFASNGWRNFCTLLTPDSVKNGDYEVAMKTENYLWSYGCGAGSYLSAGGIATTSMFKTLQLQSVFTMTFGSYFGDWDNQNNFLRAPLASNSDILVNCWAGRPNWFFHHMALGEPIGFDAYTSCVNRNTYQPPRHGMQMVHQTLLGDPTLKMYVYEAPTNLTITNTNNVRTAKIKWDASSSSGILGYYVYRSKSLNDPFTLLTNNYINTTFYNDHNASLGKNIYMIRSVKLQQSATGSFYNLSPGIIDSVSFLTDTNTLIKYCIGQKINPGNKILWQVDCSSNNIKIELQKSKDKLSYDSIYALTADSLPCQKNFSFVDQQNIDELNYYRLKATDIDGQVYFSDIVTLVNSQKNVIFEKTPFVFQNELMLQIAAPENTSVTTTVTDVSGRHMLNTEQAILEGSNYLKVNFNRLSRGIYYYSLYTKGQRLLSNAFMVK